MKNEVEIKESLMANAKNKGICKDGYSEIARIVDKDKMVKYYTDNPDWCLERGFPDLQTLTEYFSDCEDMGVFVNKTFQGELLNELQTYVFHNCRGTIKVGLNVDKSVIPMLYLANGCRLRIVGVGDAKIQEQSRVPVYTFGKNDVSAKDNRYVKFIRYKSELI